MPGMIQAEQDTEIRARVNSRKKAQANRVLKKHGWSMSAFLRVVLNAVAETGEVPAMPNAETAKALREGLRGEKLVRAGKYREEIRRALWG